MEAFLWVVIIVSILLIVNSIRQFVQTPHREMRHTSSGIYHIDDNGVLVKGLPVDGRTLDGRPLSAEDDWTQWYVWKGYADDGIVSHLRELEDKLVAPDTVNPTSVLSEWHWYYNRYRRICSRHSMWNLMIEDRSPFIPTSAQLDLEKRLFVSLERKMKDAEAKQKAYIEYSELLFSYLLNQPRHIGYREKAIASISGGNIERRRELRKVYRHMVRNHILIERQNENNAWVFRRPPTAKIKEYEFNARQCIFSSALYQKVTVRTEYKALITVGEPMDLDRELRHCKFYSKTRNTVYYTTLENCTCPTFSPGLEPCKHMVKLASTLGLYKIKVKARVEKEAPFLQQDIKPATEVSNCEDFQEKKLHAVETEEKEEERDSMIDVKSKVLYSALIQHLSDIGAEYIDKTSHGGGLYFFDENIANELLAKGYEPHFAKNGTKGTGHRPAWYVRYK